MQSLLAPFVRIWMHRGLLFASVRSEIVKRHAGSLIGLFWALLYPLILFLLYSILYLVIFRIKPVEMTGNMYLIYIMSGLLPFMGFSEALTTGTISLSAKKALLVNTVYPSEFIPLQAVLANHMTLFVGIFLLILTSLLLLHSLSWAIIVIPALVFFQLLFAIGIVWVLSILNLVIKDIQQSLSFITMLLMIISPIAYTPSMVPSSLKFLLYLNPFSYFVWAYQDIFLYGTIGSHFMAAGLIGLSSFCLGYAIYERSKKVFYEFA